MALLGLGVMGRLHARTLLSASLPGRDSPAFTVTGVFDPDDTVHLSSSLPRFATEALAIAGADLVIVASPIADHAGAAIRALTAGRDVLVEKPLGATLRDAAAMVDAARRADRRLFVGHSERFNPVVRAIASAVPPDAVRRIVLRRIGPPRRARTPAHDAVLLNLGVHDLDLVAHLTDSTLAIRSAQGGDDSADVTLSTASGCEARISIARTAGPRDRGIVVETADALYCGDLLRLTLEVRSFATGAIRAVTIEPIEPLVAQARALAEALATTDAGTTPIATGIDGARAILAVEEIEAYLRGRSVAAEQPERPAENL